MQNKSTFDRDRVRSLVVAVLAMALLAAMPAATWAQDTSSSRRGSSLSSDDLQAARLIRRGEELLEADEADRGLAILQSVVEQFPDSAMRFQAYLIMGRYYLNNSDQVKAVSYLRNIRRMETENTELTADQQNILLESLYLTGRAYFDLRNYSAAFPLLRRITTEFPNTVWANQSYYYIGLCHFAQGNWNKAIEALTLVGTMLDPDSPTTQYIEAGRRLYVKVMDEDLPVLHRLGREIKLTLTTKAGDTEVIPAIPLVDEADVFIGSIPTELGGPKANDGMLQVVGGDEIQATYVDENTQEGKAQVKRITTVSVVSTGTLAFTLGDYQTIAAAGYLGQPLFVVLNDADLDLSPSAETQQVRVISRYRVELDETEQAAQRFDMAAFLREDQVQYETRDEVTVTLTELGDPPVRTGRFGGRVDVQTVRADQAVDTSDNVLTCAVDDEVLVFYTDERHMQGTRPRDVQAKVREVSEVDSRPRATQYVVSDDVIKARKNLVEAEAYLELGRIFKSMGLMDGAGSKADEGLSRVEQVIRNRSPIPLDLRQKSFKLRWELYLVKDDFNSAIATCRLFNKLYPESPFVDQALLGIAMIKFNQREYDEAIKIFNQILSMPNSQVKAEAQFRIAESYEKLGGREHDHAILAYKNCAQRYPDSPFAGESLAKLVNHYIDNKDYAQADDLLEQVFQDYPDASFLDLMLLKWVAVAYRVGDFDKAYEKCNQLLFEYPSSRYAENAKSLLPRIEARLSR